MYYSSCQLLDEIVSFCCQMVKEKMVKKKV